MNLRHLPSLACLLALVGCGGDAAGPTTPMPGDPAVLGEWTADDSCAPTCSFILRAVADPSLEFDMLELFSSELHVTITPGAFDLRFETAFGTETVTGDLEITPTLLIITDGAAVDTVDYTLTGDLLALRFRDEVRPALDLDGDGTPDPARLEAELIRR